jgi:hypothetical protein
MATGNPKIRAKAGHPARNRQYRVFAVSVVALLLSRPQKDSGCKYVTYKVRHIH